MPKKIITISTKTGDSGQSGLANGQRLSKSQPIFAALGDFDELNSWLGVIIVKLDQLRIESPDPTAQTLKVQQNLLEQIQAWIYEASAILAQSPGFEMTVKPLQQLENQADKLQVQLGENWHQRFLYPGGTELAGWLDIVRTVARRTERSLVIWQQQADKLQLNPVTDATIVPTFNRLSDYLYILRCWVNDQAQITEKQFGQTQKAK